MLRALREQKELEKVKKPKQAQKLSFVSSLRDVTNLDKYIDLILRNVTNIDEFIYLMKRSDIEDQNNK